MFFVVTDPPQYNLNRAMYLLSGPLHALPQSLTLHSFHISIMEVPNIKQFWNVEAAGTTLSKEEDPGKQFLQSCIQSSITC